MAGGFDLHFVFLDASDLASSMADRLDALLRLSGRRLQLLRLVDFASIHDLLLAIEANAAQFNNTRAPIWLQANAGKQEEAANAQRAEMLLALNQRRGWLQENLPRPFIIVLPQAWQPEVWRLAADLWVIRGMSPGFEESLAPQVTSSIGLEPIPAPLNSGASTTDLRIAAWLALVARWRSGELAGKRLNIAQGLEAVQRALGAKADELALEILAQVDELIDLQADSVSDRLRCISMGLHGELALRQGRLAEAEQRYRASLGYRERLRELLGETPEVLRDLSVAENKLGELALRQGRLAEAEQRYRASLGYRERLRELLGETPQTLADLAFIHSDYAKFLIASGKHSADAALTHLTAAEQLYAKLRHDYPEVVIDPEDMAALIDLRRKIELPTKEA